MLYDNINNKLNSYIRYNLSQENSNQNSST